MIAVRRKGVTNVDEKASDPERIFPRIISLADTTRTCVRRSCQSGETREHNTGASLRSIPDGDKSKGKKIHGSTRGVLLCISMYMFIFSFPLRTKPGIVASQKEFLTCNMIHKITRYYRTNYSCQKS